MPDPTSTGLHASATTLLQTIGLTKRYGDFLANASVDIQYSATGTDNWHTAATIDLAGNPERTFSQEFDHPTAGFWRIRYIGEPNRFTNALSTPIYVA